MSSAGRAVEASESVPRLEDYLHIKGFRFVKPYHFDFSCTVKQRWAGQTLLDFFCREFPARSREYYEQAIADGRLRFEKGPATPDTVITTGQQIRHFIHRHEPPCTGDEVAVLGLTEDLVAVGKPAGMPVHASGQYRKNTVLGVLQASRSELGALHPAHRLDKPVSGVLLFARSPAAADALRLKIEEHQVQKTYIARVLGVFPSTPEPLVISVPLAWDQRTNHVVACPESEAPAAQTAGEVPEQGLPDPGPGPAAAAERASPPGGGESVHPSAAEPTDASTDAAKRRHAFREQRRLKAVAKQRRLAEQRVAAEVARATGVAQAKLAVTEFRLLAVAPDHLTSLVECRPRTGRTHQIRVHLQHTGHPIANDGQYGGSYAGPLAVRQIAQRLGVGWDQMRGVAGLPAYDVGVSPPGLPERAGSAGDQAAAAKRPKLDVGLRSNGSTPAAPALAQAPASAEPGADDVYALNKAFRQGTDFLAPEDARDPDCPHCPYFAPLDYPLDLRPLWLHARSYACADWAFSAPLPDWAAEDFVPEPPTPAL